MGDKLDESEPGGLDQQEGWSRAILESFYRFRWMPIAFGAACGFALMGILVNTFGDEVDTTVVSLWRTAVTCSFALIVAIFNGTSLKIQTLKELRFHVIHSILLLSKIYLQFYAYQHMAAADAAAIIYSYVAFAGIFARVFLKETFGVFETAMVALSLVGIVLIARPPFIFTDAEEEISGNLPGFLPPLVAFAASLTVAFYIVTVRTMGIKDISVMKSIFYGMLFSSICLLIPVLISGHSIMPPCICGRLRMVAMALCAFLGLSFLNYALSIEHAVYVSLVSINDALIVLVITMAFLGFRPKWTSIAGMFLIIGSSIVILARKMFAHRKKKINEVEQPVDDIPIS